MLKRQWLDAFGACIVFAFLIVTTVPVASAATFYEGKILTLIQGRTPGGLGDTRVRIATEFLKKHLPGNPTIVFKYMPGAGGTVAANHIAAVAKKDGLTIANIGSAFITHGIAGGRGVRYKLGDFEFLGAPTTAGPDVLIVRPELGLGTVEKLRAYKGLRFAERSVGHSLYIRDRIFAYVLDLKDTKWIVGYSSREIDPAIERGEADAKTDGLDTFLRETPHWLKKGFTTPVLIKTAKGEGAELVPEFPQNVATLDQYADTKLKRRVLELFHSSPGGSIFLIPKGVPDAALMTLRETFHKIWNDPQFVKDYKRLAGEPANPVTGDEISQGIQNIPREPEVLKVYKQLMGAGPVPASK